MNPKLCLLTALALLAGLHHAAAQVTFAPAVNYAVGVRPVSIAAANFYGDGKLDLVCANYSDWTVTVLTNVDCGIFSSNATFETGSPYQSGSVVAADVDGDGTPDLIVGPSNESGPAFAVLTNNGDGSFGFNNSSYGGNQNGDVYGNGIALADVNEDGNLDLICANAFNSITVWTNNGIGVFSSSATYAVGVKPRFVVATDISGDGHADLIVANEYIWTGHSYTGTLSVLTNNGNGIFASNATYTNSSAPFSIVAKDVNGDGKVDLIYANYGYYDSYGTFYPGNSLSVWTNNGSGIFHSNATYTVGNQPRSVIAADVNGDDKLDLICAYLTDNTLTILTNNGIGRFVFASTITVGNAPCWVTAADVNRDGKMDLICANSGDNTLSVLINTTIIPPPSSTLSPTIKQSRNGILVSWPSASAGWSLQQNPDLVVGNWSPSGYSGYTISDDGTNKSLVIPSQPGNLFFRLLHP